MWNELVTWWRRVTESHESGRLAHLHPSRTPMARAMRLNKRLRLEWELGGPIEFPGMRVDGVAWAASCDGLASFFEACLQGPGAVALPSLAADAVWHAWLRADPQGLDEFCRFRVGGSIPHQTKAEMREPIEDGIALCWGRCCVEEDINPLSGRLPSLFALDGRLLMPGGWLYGFDRRSGRVFHSPISAHSGLLLRSKKHFPTGLTAIGLAAAGAVSAEEYIRWSASSGGERRNSSGSGCGSSCGLGSESSSSWGGGYSDSDGSAGGHGGDGGSDGGGDGGGGCGGGD